MHSNFMMKLKLILLRIGFLLGSAVFAAGPITHVVIAEKWMHYKEHYCDNQKHAFMLGTLFPDIRYLGGISREQTHEKGLTLQILEKRQSPFLKGKRLHAWVDEVREQFVEEWGIYAKLSGISGQRYIATFLKLLEDKILYSESRLHEVRRMLLVIQPEEKQFGVDIATVEKWHKALDFAMSRPPSAQLAHLKRLHKGYAGVPKEIVAIWSQQFPKYAKRKDIQLYVRKMVTGFDNYFSD